MEINMKNDKRKGSRNSTANRVILILAVVLVLLVVVLVICIFMNVKNKKTDSAPSAKQEVQVSEEPSAEEAAREKEKLEQERQAKIAECIAKADRLAAGYDYDKAIELVEALEGYAQEDSCTEAIASYKKMKKKAVRYDKMTEIPHIFFHILTIDTDKSFDGDDMSDKYNMVMTTEKEFREIIKQMYEKGYVLIRIHDMVKEVKKDGKVRFEEGDIYLPKGKKPFVLSEDDVCYYEYMEGDGYAKRIVIGEDGKPTCEMVQEDGSIKTGEYDIVPILESFIEEHPDFSYRGARGILALTGYNGILGYRTDTVYKDNPTYKEDRKEAKRVAKVLRECGWEFASHSWGHRDLGAISMSDFIKDTQKWEKRVEPLIGDTDILIYPFGADIGSWYPYEGERYEYLKKCGFHYFCNVDSARYWVQYGDDYLRQGRRNIDGQRMYYDMIDDSVDKLSDLFDVDTVFDKARPTPVPR